MGSVVAVASGKGGVGKTCIALNLGIALAMAERKVLLIDASFGIPNLSFCAGMKAMNTGLQEIVSEHGGRVPSAAVYSYKVSGGNVDLLPCGAPGIGRSGPVEPNMNLLKKVVTSLSQKYEHVILDTAPGLCGHSLGPVLLAEQALIVVTPDPLSQLGAQMLKRTLHVLNPGEKMMLILNMSVEKGGPTVAELQEGIGLNVLGVIPEDREMREAAQSGIPLMIHRPKSKAASAIRAIAEEFLAEEALRAARKSGKD